MVSESEIAGVSAAIGELLVGVRKEPAHCKLKSETLDNLMGMGRKT